MSVVDFNPRRPNGRQAPISLPVGREATLVGGALVDPARWTGHLPPLALTDPLLRLVWEEIGQAIEDGMGAPGVVLPVVTEAMQAAPGLQERGGLSFLNTLAQAAPARADFSLFARDLHRDLQRRRSRRFADEEGDDEDDPFAKVDRLYSPAGELSASWARAYVHRDPSTLPLRQWLYGGHYIRRFVTTTVAPGGLGKSALVLGESLAMVTGKPLLGEPVGNPLRAWLWNGEDPLDETERRLAAAMKLHGLGAADVGGRLFLGSGRDAELVIAAQERDGTVVAEPVVEAVMAMIGALQLDVVVIDPFVSSHRVPENDNGAVDRVAKQWARIADVTGCAVELVHHVRKGTGLRNETTVEDGRGAVALHAAARSARVLNTMTAEEGRSAGVDPSARFRVSVGKSNLAAAGRSDAWFAFESVSLGNGGLEGGDSVGVVTRWRWPETAEAAAGLDLPLLSERLAEGGYRQDVRSPAWAGLVVAELLDLDPKADRKRVLAAIEHLLTIKVLRVEMRPDRSHQPRAFIMPGEAAA